MDTPATWTLDDLSARADEKLRDLGLATGAADPRTVRYYQTLGILDRPLSYEGHKARYGPRHLLQLLVVSALKRHRLELSEIQSRIYGLSDAELEALLASVPRPAAETEARLPVTVLREVVLEPGLKLVADGGWMPGEDPERLVQLFRAVVSALGAQAPESSGS